MEKEPPSPQTSAAASPDRQPHKPLKTRIYRAFSPSGGGTWKIPLSSSTITIMNTTYDQRASSEFACARCKERIRVRYGRRVVRSFRRNSTETRRDVGNDHSPLIVR